METKKNTLEGKLTNVNERIVLKEDEICNVLKRMKPDGVRSSVIKLCAEQLSGVLCTIFIMSLKQCAVPEVWKISCIVPLPKKHPVNNMNDLRPVALTSCVTKVFEKCIMPHVNKIVRNFLDPYQYAYQAKRGVDDAMLHVLNNIYIDIADLTLNSLHTTLVFQAEDKGVACSPLSSGMRTLINYSNLSSNYIYIFDLCSMIFAAHLTPFNPILCEKLVKMNVYPSLILRVLDYLNSNLQFLRFSPTLTFNTIKTNTRAPQGTVLSPFLFSIYTSDCRPQHDDCRIDKHADDTYYRDLL